MTVVAVAVVDLVSVSVCIIISTQFSTVTVSVIHYHYHLTKEKDMLAFKLDLLTFDSESTFMPLFTSEMAFDTLSRHVVLLRQPVSSSRNHLVTALATVAWDHCWKASLTAESTLESVLDRATQTILKLELKGASLILGLT